MKIDNDIKIKNVLTVSEFAGIIEKMVAETGVDYMDACMSYAAKHNIEIETIGSLIKNNSILKAKLQAECEAHHMIKRSHMKMKFGLDIMNPFEAYRTYLALNRHFTLDSYDYFKYNGKVNVNVDSFERRNDKYHFIKLSRQTDPEQLVLANIIDNPSPKQVWIGDIVSQSGLDRRAKWLGRQESLGNTFKSDLSALLEQYGSLISTLKVDNKNHLPKLMMSYARNRISVETLIIIDQLTGCFERWSNKIEDPIYLPKILLFCSKYHPFMKYDLVKFKKILLDVASDRG